MRGSRTHPGLPRSDEEPAPAPAATAAPAEEASEAEEPVAGVVQTRPAGATEVRVSLAEWTVEASVASVAAGEIYFLVDNLGPADPHEFVVIRTDLPIDQLPTNDTGFVPEDQVDVIGEIEPFTPASAASMVLNLTPGRYLLICNVVELEEGEWESHYLEGMRTEFIVEPAGEASEAEDAQPGVVEPQPAGSTEVRVSLAEWTVAPSVSSVAAGDIYFLVDNLGPVDPHEFVIIRTDLPIDGLPTDDTGFVPEDQIDLVGEIEPFTPASSASGVFNLTPGRYLLICNVVELEEGEWESHYLEGMRVEFIVEGPESAASEAEDAVAGVVEPQPAGSTEVRVSLSEWAVTPSVSSVAAGDIYFLVDNLGPVDPHEFVIIRTDLPIDGLPTDDTGFVPEDQIDLVGEIEPFTPASSASGVFNLTPGRYLLICNVVELEEGAWESHYLEGMRVEFIVE